MIMHYAINGGIDVPLQSSQTVVNQQANRNVVKLQTTNHSHDARVREETHVSNIVLCVDDQVREVTAEPLEPLEPSEGAERRRNLESIRRLCVCETSIPFRIAVKIRAATVCDKDTTMPCGYPQSALGEPRREES
jgi:hypothetical protein